jgi:solute:Na+ symporter, SSS family
MELSLIAVLSVASSAGLIVVVPAIVGTFFWKRGTAAGVLSSVIIAGLIVILLEMFQLKPFGLASGLWGISISTLLFIGVSLITRAPEAKANEFLSYVSEALKSAK